MAGIPDHEKILTTGQLAKLFHVAPRTACQWIDRGVLSGFRLPGSKDRRVLREDVVKFAIDNGMQRLLPAEWLPPDPNGPPPAVPMARAA